MGKVAGQLIRAQLRERDGDDCWLCGTSIDFTRRPGTLWGPSIEHVRPRADGGTSDLSNLRLTHAFPCNKARGDARDRTGSSGRQQQQIATAVAMAKARDRKLSYHDQGAERARQMLRR
jgi:hypothetical protein